MSVLCVIVSVLSLLPTVNNREIMEVRKNGPAIVLPRMTSSLRGCSPDPRSGVVVYLGTSRWDNRVSSFLRFRCSS